jgi:hypothetical protein
MDYLRSVPPRGAAHAQVRPGIESVPCTAEAFAEFDAVLVSTAHAQFKDLGLGGGVKPRIYPRNPRILVARESDEQVRTPSPAPLNPTRSGPGWTIHPWHA